MVTFKFCSELPAETAAAADELRKKEIQVKNRLMLEKIEADCGSTGWLK